MGSNVLIKHILTDSAYSEYLSTELVRITTRIPVPKAEKVIAAPQSNFYLVQQFIPGEVLDDVWSTLSWWKQLRVALTVRYYIHELRSIASRIGPPPFPGPPSVDGTPQVCEGRLFTSMGPGPFSTYQDLAKWYNNRLLVVRKFRNEGIGAQPFDASVPLVFTHLDLHMGNLILGHDGQLWIIDWAEAGWYPSWFEAASMKWWVDGIRSVPQSWRRLVPYMAGSCEKPGQMKFLRAIAFSLTTMPPNIMNLVSVK
jgi:hypothetical protein